MHVFLVSYEYKVYIGLGVCRSIHMLLQASTTVHRRVDKKFKNIKMEKFNFYEMIGILSTMQKRCFLTFSPLIMITLALSY